MDRVAVFVDAGYLFAQGSYALTGQRMPRNALQLLPDRVLEFLTNLAFERSSLPLLRVYWYDGQTAQHETLAHVDGIKMRLGYINSSGEQKGVDSLIVTDMITLARNHAISDALLLSGDEDTRVGMQQAQEFGVRVHLVGIRPSRGTQSMMLQHEADTNYELSPAELATFLVVRAESTVALEPVDGAKLLEEVAVRVAAEVIDSDLAALLESIQKSGQMPKEIDGRLLALSGSRLEHSLDSKQKAQLRKTFVALCEARFESLQLPG